MPEEKLIKSLLFEVYSAGYEAGYAGKDNLASAFEQYYEKIRAELQEQNGSEE